MIVKDAYREKAERLFGDTGIQITIEGRKHLGAVIGSQEFKNKYVPEKIDEWKNLLLTLSIIVKTEPHMAYSLFAQS